MIDITSIILRASSWALVVFAFALAIQNVRYLRKNCTRRQNLHFAFAILALYMGGLYLTAAIEPGVWIIRSGLATKIGIGILFWMLYTVTKADETDYRLDDRIGRRQ